MNGKFIKHIMIMELITAAVFAVLYLLTANGIINPYNRVLNFIIYGVFTIFIIVYFTLINEIDDIDSFDCGAAIGIYIFFASAELLFSFQRAGIHLSICVVCGGAVFSLICNSIGRVLQRKDNESAIDNKKYERIIRKVDYMKYFMLIGMIIFGASNAFSPFLDSFQKARIY